MILIFERFWNELPFSFKHYSTSGCCTATHTATPTKSSRHWRYAANTRSRNEGRGGRQRTMANPLRRFPYALFAPITTSRASSHLDRGTRIFGRIPLCTATPKNYGGILSEGNCFQG